MDIKEISIQYQASNFSSTLAGLSIFSNRVTIEPKTLQTATEATQLWNEFLKALVMGYNSCAVTKEQYAEGLNQLFPRLKKGADELEKGRKNLQAGRSIDVEHLNKTLRHFEQDLHSFAKIAQKNVDYERIENIVEDKLKHFNWKEVFDELEKSRQSSEGDVIATRIFWLTREPGATMDLGPCPGEKCFQFRLGAISTREDGVLIQEIILNTDVLEIKRRPGHFEMNSQIHSIKCGWVVMPVRLNLDVTVNLCILRDSGFEIFGHKAYIKMSVIDDIASTLRIKLEVKPPQEPPHGWAPQN